MSSGLKSPSPVKMAIMLVNTLGYDILAQQLAELGSDFVMSQITQDT